MSKFRSATRQKTKASIMIEGIQGSGKSGLALLIGHALADNEWENVYAIDTENKSLDLFEGIKSNIGDTFGAFNKVDLTAEDGYAPSNYKKLRDAAIDEAAQVVIMDSISHMWNRKGGLLDTVTEASQALGGDNYRAWGTDKNREEKELIFDLVRSPKVHIITTVRTKEKFGMEFDETKGKNRVVSLGEQQIQQDGLKYEPDLVLRMVSAGNMDGTDPVAEVTKSRYAIFKVGEEYTFDKTVLEQLSKYLEEGTDPEELLKVQHDALVKDIQEYCGSNQVRKSVWQQLKKNAGFEGKKINNIPLDTLKVLYKKLTEE